MTRTGRVLHGQWLMIISGVGSVFERPITFRAAENLGAFQLAELWADRTAWPINERTVYDEPAELATMSASAKWLTRWHPIAIHGAVMAGARMDAAAGALGESMTGST